mmetsp:Transcript_8267/g.12678  ORF Transcript_8267/g.12678 Transcript_8267/m.12678 type:complete len:267 (+) Transcript_8267:119-919(+)
MVTAIPILLNMPSWDAPDGIFRAWWFDPMVASISFAFFINWYWCEERKRGLSSDNEKFLGVSWSPLFQSLASYWIGVYLFKSVVPPPAPTLPDGFPDNLVELSILAFEVIAGIVLYDFIFFFIHWAMHDLPFAKSIHKRHHSKPDGTVEARDTLRHSLMDGSLQVLVNIVVQRRTLWGTVKSRLARTIHNIIVVWMLTESHTASPKPYIWRRWFVGVREHRLHHFNSEGIHHDSRFQRHQQFFGYLDNLRALVGEKNRLTTNKRVV